jgi:hypothetical protein
MSGWGKRGTQAQWQSGRKIRINGMVGGAAF